ncbi:ketoacyl-synt-domain-containing protein, partial [Glonium stellatum]
EPIAVVGASCRFPGGATSPSKLWDLLSNPRDLRRPIPEDRFNSKGFYNENGERYGSTNVCEGYFLDEDFRAFDSAFFNINPREAEAIDPQQRNLLELVYEAIESAGFTLDGLRGSQTAVYTGLMSVDYHELQMRDPDSMPKYTATGTARSIVSNRISYFFDWQGPSMTIDTACSSSLIAVHQAVQSLRSGESTLAVATGTNLILGPELYINAASLHMLSPTARSRMWDANADGYVRGEGFAAVVLKRLSDAIRDNDHIESIIRGTGTNQDGRTKGITMPSSEAQSRLIKRTYRQCGLDPRKLSDRPHFFEAHGTGTPAGDPVEAEAIYAAFFDDDEHPLYVGSIKTIIGHLEGCAGLAGLLKSSLALANSVIPSNMLFERLNPSIKPFYNDIEIPTSTLPWPSVPQGSPRRASTNSFGFGGSNCHCILESFETSIEIPSQGMTGPCCLPFLFSANSQTSLFSILEAFATYLESQDVINESDLAWTLHARRTCFPVRVAIPTSTEQLLLPRIRALLAQKDSPRIVTQGHALSNTGRPSFFGIFTGQGAQWPTMGRELILHSRAFNETIKRLESALKGIPDAPEWILSDELLADSKSSRVHEALISQPLCTAVQIGLVNLLQHASINFDAVVGHSSGEIAAAYAAGFLTEADAIRISYYRGHYAKLARGVNGEAGAMLAVGMSMAQAQAFITARPALLDRICVAASNSHESVTLSGDESAVAEVRALMDADGTFCRKLKVNVAYHSHHMQACAQQYRSSLQALHIRARVPRRQCEWHSSVDSGHSDWSQSMTELQDDYWVRNLVNPVLFSEAVESAFRNSSVREFRVAFEVGPHPALQGPFNRTVEALGKEAVPYASLLKRNNDALSTLSAALGTVWENAGPKSVNLDSYERACNGLEHRTHKLVTGLPAYAWDHTQAYWRESRLSRSFRLRETVSHELLGVRTHDSTEKEPRWRNILRIEDLSWVQGHRVQGQILLPAAAFLIMAVEACRAISKGWNVKAFELEDVTLSKAIVFGNDTEDIETIFSLQAITYRNEDEDHIATASFACHSSAGASSDRWSKNVSGKVRIIEETTANEGFPGCVPFGFPLTEVDSKFFYDSLDAAGLNYSSSFRRLACLQRRLNNARASIAAEEYKSSGALIHPAVLDMTFQTLFLAFCYPNDGRLDTPYVPTKIHRLSVLNSIERWQACGVLETQTTLNESQLGTICADVNTFDSHENQTLMQLEGLTLTAIGGFGAKDDRELFCKTIWKPDITAGALEMPQIQDTANEAELVDLCERLSFAYLRDFVKFCNNGKVLELKWHQKCLIDFAQKLIPRVEAGLHPTLKQEWASDNLDQLVRIAGKYPNQIDLQMIQAVGRNLPATIQNEVAILEVMMEDDMLNRYYKDGLGFERANKNLSETAARLTHRFAGMNIIEVGAGTGGATKSILAQLQGRFSSYTFTDVSTGFFERARAELNKYDDKMKFIALDIENDTSTQGFQEHAYDLIIASNVLHATGNLRKTMQNVRRLMRPGGYLLMLEVTSEILRVKLMMSGLPGWWLGSQDGRTDGPTVSEATWNKMLQSCEFSGVDMAIRDFDDTSRYMTSVILTQAVDDTVKFLRQPLSGTSQALQNSDLGHVLIVGGPTVRLQGIIKRIQNILSSKCGPSIKIRTAKTMEDVASFTDTPGLVLSLTDLDGPFFERISATALQGLQTILNEAKFVLWVTQGCRADNPWGNMSVGLTRSLQSELPHVQFQMLDVDSLAYDQAIISNLISSTLVRLACMPTLSKDMLWTTESEIAYVQGNLWIPRILPNDELNNRLNASKRRITKETNLLETPVEIILAGAACQLTETLDDECGERQVKLSITHSTVGNMMANGQTPASICLGSIIDIGSKVTNFFRGDQVISLCSKNASHVILEEDALCHCRVPISVANAFIQNLVDSIRIRSMAATLPSEGAVILLNASRGIKDEFRRMSSLEVVSLVSEKSSHIDEDSSFIHQMMTERAISTIVPRNVIAIVECGNFGQKGLRERIKSSLKLKGDGNAFHHVLSCDLAKYTSVSPLHLKEAARNLSNQLYTLSKSMTFVNIADIPAIEHRKNDLLVVDWRATDAVLTTLQPLQLKKILRSDRTYFLVGFTGGLGQSLCRWMVSNGALYLALATRNRLAVDGAWLQELRRLGATVNLYQMDVGDLAEVIAVRDRITRELPPIIGVANAAMVLADKPFNQMTHTDLTKVLTPKVHGSLNLDAAFPDGSLDFFILFSSLACVVGNRGQSNYSAANMFMTSLASQRRKRGLAASVIDIGMVLGVGYIARTGIYEASLRRFNYMPISEPDIHTIFAEAIVAGQRGSWADCEIITGLNRIKAANDGNEEAFWHAIPRFCHHIEAEDASGTDGSQGKDAQSRISLRQKLGIVSPAEQEGDVPIDIARDVITEYFVAKLHRVLQTPVEKIEVAKALVDMGIDSLMAVDVRSWFLKELNVDIPVFKILGGASINDLCNEASSRF